MFASGSAKQCRAIPGSHHLSASCISAVWTWISRFSRSTGVWAEFDCGIRVGYHTQRYLRILDHFMEWCLIALRNCPNKEMRHLRLAPAKQRSACMSMVYFRRFSTFLLGKEPAGRANGTEDLVNFLPICGPYSAGVWVALL